ncbi:hypothetical protein BACCAP_03906 [Pseudoflavonifractor capillosus ATCC 29799]|uniref:Uncharacterized protein n=1 Tax=Pseudoflavonifractor capillosus ATCC 29799 TaxID=411467 RepID=A6P098_9FIRM|nr:hypothetical protein BACCAP_03906 [Pseudoflavonifractor capillosus ATCC 29799]
MITIRCYFIVLPPPCQRHFPPKIIETHPEIVRDAFPAPARFRKSGP